MGLAALSLSIYGLIFRSKTASLIAITSSLCYVFNSKKSNWDEKQINAAWVMIGLGLISQYLNVRQGQKGHENGEGSTTNTI